MQYKKKENQLNNNRAEGQRHNKATSNMKYLEVFKNSCAAGLLSANGLTCRPEAENAVNRIKDAAQNTGVIITFWNGEKVTFVSVYSHTLKVPAKALKNLESFSAWTIDRVNHYYRADGVKLGIL